MDMEVRMRRPMSIATFLFVMIVMIVMTMKRAPVRMDSTSAVWIASSCPASSDARIAQRGLRSMTRGFPGLPNTLPSPPGLGRA